MVGYSETYDRYIIEGVRYKIRIHSLNYRRATVDMCCSCAVVMGARIKNLGAAHGCHKAARREKWGKRGRPVALISEFVGHQTGECSLGKHARKCWVRAWDSPSLAADIICSGRDAVGSEVMLRVPNDGNPPPVYL